MIKDEDFPNEGETITAKYEDYFTIMIEGHEDPDLCYVTIHWLPSKTLIAFKDPIGKDRSHWAISAIFAQYPVTEFEVEKKAAVSDSKNNINQSYEFAMSGGGHTAEYKVLNEMREAAHLKGY